MLEATSFVHPNWVPQLADAAELLARLVRAEGVDYPVLVPNERGLDRALDAGVEHIAIFASATETFARAQPEPQPGRPVRDVRAGRRPGAGRRAAGARLRVDVLRRPVGGRGGAEQVAAVGRRLVELGCGQLSLGDTIGTGTPGHVDAVLDACVAAGVPVERGSPCTSTTPTGRRWPTRWPRCAAG